MTQKIRGQALRFCKYSGGTDDQYDAAGSVVYSHFTATASLIPGYQGRPDDDYKWWNFDAAGRMKRLEHYNTGDINRKTAEETAHDGDGRSVVRTEFQKQKTGGVWQEWNLDQAELHLWSSVTGQKMFDGTATQVYLGGTVIAKIESETTMTFHLTDPVTGSSFKLLQDGSLPLNETIPSHVELAGLGTSVPLTEPTAYPMPESFPNVGYPGDAEGGCFLDGFQQSSCKKAMWFVGHGLADIVMDPDYAGLLLGRMGIRTSRMPIIKKFRTTITVYDDEDENDTSENSNDGIIRVDTNIDVDTYEWEEIVGWETEVHFTGGSTMVAPPPPPPFNPCDKTVLVSVVVSDASTDRAVSNFPYLNAAVVDDFNAAQADIGMAGRIVGFSELFRPLEVQQDYWNRYQANIKATANGRPKPYPNILKAAKPGNSNHGAGYSFDMPSGFIHSKLPLGPNKGKTVEQIFNSHGFFRNEPGDPVHFNYRVKPSAAQKREALDYYTNCLK